MSKGMLAVLLALLLVLVAGGMLVSAADAAVPGDWMYGMDRTMDGLRLRLAWNSKEQAQVERQLAQERLREAQMLVRRGDLKSVELLRQESRLAMLAAKAADPHYARKMEKATSEPEQVEKNAQRIEQISHRNDDPYCSVTSTKHNIAGERLAQRLAVSYSEVMGWYCQGNDFSEIGLAYRIGRGADVTVGEVFSQHDAGLGWVELIQKYNLDGRLEKDKLKHTRG
jgi:hypothetical protein